MDWARVLAYVTGTVDRELLARNEYLAAENRILKSQLNGRLKVSGEPPGRHRRHHHSPGRAVASARRIHFIYVRACSGGRYVGGSQSNRGDAPTAVVRGPGDAASSDAEA
jgi:hypothetical protein